MKNQIILVTGAAGNQGGAVARNLLQRKLKVRAFVHHPDKPEAKELTRLGAEVIEGDFDDRASLDRALKGAHGVFSVQDPMTVGIEAEIQQGKEVIDAAKAARVKHFVYSSVGSADRNTGIPQFDSKGKIEEHLRAAKLNYTVLRPVFFYYNYDKTQLREMIRRGTLTLPLSPDTRLQQLSEDDYGHIVATVFERSKDFFNRAVEVASCELTMRETAEIFSRVTGHRVDYRQIPWDEFEKAVGSNIAKMYRWFEDVGFKADLEALGKEFGKLTGLEEYLRARGSTEARKAGGGR